MVWCVLNETKCETMKTLISQYDDDDDDDDDYKIDFSTMILTNRVQGLLWSFEKPVWEDSIIRLEIYYLISNYILHISVIDILVYIYLISNYM